MITHNGMIVLESLYKEHRKDWLERFPGSNENDVERSFIYLVYSGINEGTNYIPDSLRIKVEEIL